MQCPREGWWLTWKCCGGLQGVTVWWWQNLVTGVLTACSSYTTTQGSSEGCGSSPGLILNKESLLLTLPMPAFSAFFKLLPFLTTTSLWALPFHSWAALPRAPHHNLGVLCNFRWPEHLTQGNTEAGVVRVSLRQRNTGHALVIFGNLSNVCKLQAWD